MALDEQPASDGAAASTGSPEKAPSSPATPAKASGAGATKKKPSESTEKVGGPQIVLRFIKGTGRVISTIPARDLSSADIARRVYVKTRLKPKQKGFEMEYNGLVERLANSGLYEKE